MSFLKLNSKYCKLTPEQRLYNLDRPVIGLTGGIATGKSTASSILASHGACIIDADALVKKIYKKNETKIMVSQIVPEAICDDQIDFKKLREAFFNDGKVKSKIETFIYSRLPNQFLETVNTLPSNALIIYDVPLLFEKGLDKLVDLTVVVYAPKEIQVQRLIKRDRVDEKLAKKIISNQMDIDEKRGLADFVIKNISDINDLNVNIEKFLKTTTTQV